MSYAKKAKKGYYGIAEYRDKNGKRHQKSAGCFKLKRDAIKAAQQLEDKYSRVNCRLLPKLVFNLQGKQFSV